MEKKKIDKMKVAIYSIHSDYKKLSTDFEKLKNLVTECLQNKNIERHGMDIFNLIMDIDYPFRSSSSQRQAGRGNRPEKSCDS